MEVGLQMKRLSGSEDEKEEKQVQFTISASMAMKKSEDSD
jgi:hypothetical protein